MLDDGTYISNWPANNQAFDESRPANFNQDLRDEGTYPQMIYVPGLDEGAITEWWKGRNGNMDYSFYTNNCFDTVAEALEIGGKDMSFELLRGPGHIFYEVHNPNYHMGSFSPTDNVPPGMTPAPRR